MSAAPLKRDDHLHNDAVLDEFPRSNERGPVEACVLPASHPPRGSFPRSNERGPVEATKRYCRKSPPRGNFRARMSAAPLKPPVSRHNFRAGFRFPRSNERGPVEASFLVFSSPVAGLISALE